MRGVLPQCRAAHGAHTLLRLEGGETNRRARKIKKKKRMPQLRNEELLTSLMEAARPWDRGPCGEELIQIVFYVKARLKAGGNTKQNITNTKRTSTSNSLLLLIL